MNGFAAINAYTKVGLESSVVASDPHRLITMLFQGALLAIANARNAMQRKEIPAKSEAISKAVMIINEGLYASLDRSVGGELAENLASLYEYMSTRLIQANAKNDMAALDEVTALLLDLKTAWESIRPVPAGAVSTARAGSSVNQAPARPSPVAQLYGKG